jgi:hypothetical protein
MFTARSLARLRRRLDHGSVSYAMRKTLPQVAHRSATHVSGQHLKQRFVSVLFGQEGIVHEQIDLSLASSRELDYIYFIRVLQVFHISFQFLNYVNLKIKFFISLLFLRP